MKTLIVRQQKDWFPFRINVGAEIALTKTPVFFTGNLTNGYFTDTDTNGWFRPMVEARHSTILWVPVKIVQDDSIKCPKLTCSSFTYTLNNKVFKDTISSLSESVLSIKEQTLI